MSELDAHRDNFRRSATDAPPALRALREQAFARFGALGFPTTRHEDWKYTNLAPLERQTFAVPEPPAAAPSLASAERLGAGIELVFVNGSFVASLSTRGRLPPGAMVTSLAEAIAEHGELVLPHLGCHAAFEDDGLTALNTAFLRDGAFVLVPPDAAIDLPIHCLFVSEAARGPTLAHPRTLIVAGADSRATVVEQYVGAAEQLYWTNAVTEIVLGPRAELTHYRVQRESSRAFHIGTVAAVQHDESRLTSHATSFGAALARVGIATRLDAPGASCTLDGLYLGSGGQHVDHHTTIDHRRPRGTSRELYKGILDGHATGVFNGKVFVRPDAQQSDARQLNKNLLLSDDAQVDSKPQLEILADDVKCSHGATIGALDDDAVFYLRARGIDDDAARQMLIHAFANELIDRVTVAPLQARLAREIDTRLTQLPAGAGADGSADD